MKQIILFAAISFLTITSRSQTIFIKEGKIEFERKTNTHRLYFSGEILDVDGRLGGFNFQWAWSSAWVVASALARA